MSKKLIISLAVAVVLIGAVFILGNQYLEDVTEVNLPTGSSVNQNSATDEVKPAPSFKLQTLDGETVALEDFKGKSVILNFWATW